MIEEKIVIGENTKYPLNGLLTLLFGWLERKLSYFR